MIRPTAATSIFDEPKKRAVDTGTVWGVDSAEVGQMQSCIGPDSLVYFRGNTVGRIDLKTGQKAWEHQSEARVGTALAAPGMTVVAYEDGHIEGIKPDGQEGWDWKASGRVWCFAPGTGDMASMNIERQPEHLPYHMGISPATGEVLWRSAGANLEKGVPFANGHLLLKSSNQMICVDPRTGDVKARLPFNGYGRELVGFPDGSGACLDQKAVRSFKLTDGQIAEQWKVEVDKDLTGLRAGPGVLYVSAMDKVIGLDPVSGKELWSNDLMGGNTSYDTQVLADGALLIPCGDTLTCIEPNGDVRFRHFQDGQNSISRLRVTDRGLIALHDPAPEPYRLELLDIQTGKPLIYAEITRDTPTPWLDQDGRLVKVYDDRVEMLELPELSSLPDLPAELPPDGGRKVVAETHGSVVIGGVRVKRKGQ